MSQEPLILLENNSATRHYVNEKFKQKNIDLKPQIEIAAHELLLRFASIHLGVSCVTQEFSQESIANNKVRQMKLCPPLPPRSIGYAYLKHYPLSPAAAAFLELIKK